MSIMGCGSEDMAEILSALGYQSFQPAETNPPVEAADANGAANEEIQVAATEAEQQMRAGLLASARVMPKTVAKIPPCPKARRSAPSRPASQH